MFEKSTIEAYRQVKAPVELKERVMESYQTKPANVINLRLYKTLSVIAACLILILSGTAFGNRENVSILYNGEQLTGQPMIISEVGDEAAQGVAMASLERSMPVTMCVPLEIETTQEATITAFAGEMQIFSSDTGELLFTGTEYLASDTVSVEWYVESEQEASVCIASEKTEYVVRLAYDEANDTWTIVQE